MGTISHLEPTRVFTYFEEICQIPHGSRNLQKISDYFVNFAKEKNFFIMSVPFFFCHLVLWQLLQFYSTTHLTKNQ